MLKLGNLGNRAHTRAAMALLLLLREYLWEAERGGEREESRTDMESHDCVCHIISKEIKSCNTFLVPLVDQLYSHNLTYCDYNIVALCLSHAMSHD